MWKRGRSTDKRYPGDNRLIFPKSPYRRDGLAPRCRLLASWGWGRSQGVGCLPLKAARELGLERRETVRSLSAARVRNLRKAVPSTRGPGRTNLWCASCPARGMAGWPRSEGITAESISAGSLLPDEVSHPQRGGKAPSQTTGLIGRRCTHGNVFSRPVLIGRGLP